MACSGLMLGCLKAHQFLHSYIDRLFVWETRGRQVSAGGPLYRRPIDVSLLQMISLPVPLLSIYVRCHAAAANDEDSGLSQWGFFFLASPYVEAVPSVCLSLVFQGLHLSLAYISPNDYQARPSQPSPHC